MIEYRFTSLWQIEAPLQQVFDVILDSHQWPQWWHGVRAVRELAPGDHDGIGSVRRYVWQSPTLYRIKFDARAEHIKRPLRIEASVSGDLTGHGIWIFSQTAHITTVRYEWRVGTARGWMDSLARMMPLLFELNHRILMRRGAQGLARRLDAHLVTASSVNAGSRENRKQARSSNG